MALNALMLDILCDIYCIEISVFLMFGIIFFDLLLKICWCNMMHKSCLIVVFFVGSGSLNQLFLICVLFAQCSWINLNLSGLSSVDDR